jgi:ElaB/YqjD/DUF883 family membrane-anchored ribosome-binding protein
MNDIASPLPQGPSASRDKLVADLKVVIADAEDLLKLSAGQAGEKVGELRQRIQLRLDATKAELARVQSAALTQAREAGKAADDFVHEQPWTAVGVAAGVGLLLGLLAARR